MTNEVQEIDFVGEQLLRDFLEKEITNCLIPINQLPLKNQEILDYDYLDLRNYLQKLYLKGDDFEVSGFESFIFHLIQNRRESLENLFYLGKIFSRIKSPLVIYTIIYSNYHEWKLQKRFKPLYPIKRAFGISSDYERGFVFPHFELRRFEYPIYFDEINKFLTLFFKNSHNMFSNIDLQDCLDYQSKAILFNKVSPDRYEQTLKIGCRVLARGFDTVYWHIAITKNISLIKDTIQFSVSQIEKYQLNLNYDFGFGDEYYIFQQFVSIKYLIDTLGSIPNHFEEFEALFQQLDKYPKLKNELAKARKRQQRLLKTPNYKYSIRAGSNLDYFYDFGLADYEIIEKLRFKDLSEHETVVYPNDDIHSSEYYYFSYRKAILSKCKYPDKINAKSEREMSNEVRAELGVPRFGEGWKNETFLFKIIYELFETVGVEVIHHYRPSFLKGQELDIYFEHDGKRIGIEYQGLQHFEPVDYFGGELTFAATVERDERKKRICIENTVTLIYVNYDETISQDFVLRRLKEYGIQTDRRFGTTRLRAESSAADNSTYKKLAVQWLNDPDSYRDCASPPE